MSNWRTKTNGTGVSLSLVFDTKAAMNTYIADNVNKLKPGQQFLIKDSTSCEYWWNGSAAVPLRGEMSSDIDLDDYVTKDGVELLKNKTIEAPTIREAVPIAFTEHDLPTIESEDAYNWKVACYGEGIGFVALSNSTIGLFSADGETWQETTLPEAHDWGVIAFGNGRFVAATSNLSLVSTDGKNWEIGQLAFGSQSWGYQICYALKKFWINSWQNDNFQYSTDGLTWEKISGVGRYKWASIGGNDNIVVAIANNTADIKYSTDGTNFQLSHLSLNGYWSDVIYDSDTKKFIAIANCILYNVSDSRYSISSDGINWETKTFPRTGRWGTCNCAGDGHILVVQNGLNWLLESSDAENWTQINLPNSWSGIRICYGNYKFIWFSSTDNTYLVAQTRQDTTLTPSTLATKADIAAIDLSPYATTSDVSATYATKSNPQLSGGTIDGSSATNVWLNETCRLTTSKLLSSDGSTLTFPSSSGTIATMADIEEHTPDLSTYVTLDGRETLTNKTLTSPIINSVIVSNNNNIALPSAAGTLTTLAGRETLTNKTLTSPIINEIVTTDNVTLALPSAAGTLATQSWVNTQIGNIGIDIQLYNLTGRASTTISSSWNWFYLLKLTSKIYVLSFSCTVDGTLAQGTTYQLIPASTLITSSSHTIYVNIIKSSSTGGFTQILTLSTNGLEMCCNGGSTINGQVFSTTQLLVLSGNETITINLE